MTNQAKGQPAHNTMSERTILGSGFPLDAEPLPYISVHIPGESPREVILNRPRFTIGRDEHADIVLVQPASRHHGHLENRAGVWHYTDLNSTNGTYINGEFLRQADLRDGDILHIGDAQGNSLRLVFHARQQIEKLPLPSLATSGTVAMGQTMLAGQTSLIIGRDPQVALPLRSSSVSRHHARVDITPEGPVLLDLGSTNGTFVNGQRVVKPYLLKQNDIIQIGSFRLVYDGQSLQQYDQRGAMRIDVRDLTLEIKGGRKILNNVSLSIAPREFVALVGGSGAGKSTLMKAISGVGRATSGQVLVNGDDYYRYFDAYRSVLGYVPQYEILHRALPVYGALDYAARLRLPADTAPEEITQRIEKSLDDVEMRDHKTTVLDNLSGGQIKRVSIAGELLAEPSLFFLDEPTSGLDPGLEKKMMYTMRQLANSGRTVVLVTHATDNITQCDHVAFLSQGRLVYFGPPNEALPFFGVTSGSFADIYTRLDGRASQHPEAVQTVLKQAYDAWKVQHGSQQEPLMAELWEDHYRQSPQYQRYVAGRLAQTPQAKTSQSEDDRPKKPRVSPLRQFAILTRRYIDLMLRDRRNLAILLLQAPIIAVLVWLLAAPDALIGSQAEDTIQRIAAQNLLFILAVVAIWFGVINSAREITKERAIYRRERLSNLTIPPYLLSKVTVLSVLMLIQNISLLIILAIPLLGRGVTFPTGTGLLLPGWIELFVTIMLTSLAGMAIGLFISAISRNADQAISLVPLVLIPQILFTGIIFKLESGLTELLSRLMISRWSLDALGTSANLAALCQLPNVAYENTIDTQCVVNEQLQGEPITWAYEFLRRGVEPPDTFANAFTHTTDHLLLTWGVLLAFILVGLVLTAWQLKQQDRQV